MPAITRRQSAINKAVEVKYLEQSTTFKGLQNVQQIQVSVVADELSDKRTNFINKIKPMMDKVSKQDNMLDKMKTLTEVYQIINKELPAIYRGYREQTSAWFVFTCTAFTKIIEFEKTIRDAPHYKFSSELLEKFNKEISETKQFCVGEVFITDNDLFRTLTIPYVVKAKNLLDKILSGEEKSKRSVKRVNYVGMDDEEQNVDCDPDYIFEEEEDDKDEYEYEANYADSLDEEDEDEDKEVSVCKRRFENGKVTYKWTKMPLSQFKENEDPEYIPEEEEDEEEEEQISNYKSKLRQSKAIDYTGMDMNEDDEGEFHISKKMLDDGELIHYWVTAPIAEINDYDDEDYVYEDEDEEEDEEEAEN